MQVKVSIVPDPAAKDKGEEDKLVKMGVQLVQENGTPLGDKAMLVSGKPKESKDKKDKPKDSRPLEPGVAPDSEEKELTLTIPRGGRVVITEEQPPLVYDPEQRASLPGEWEEFSKDEEIKKSEEYREKLKQRKQAEQEAIDRGEPPVSFPGYAPGTYPPGYAPPPPAGAGGGGGQTASHGHTGQAGTAKSDLPKNPAVQQAEHTSKK